MNFFSFFLVPVSPETNPYADKTGFFVNPAGPTSDQFAALGGQGMSIVNYIKGEGTAEEAMDNIAEEHHQILLDAGLITE